MAVVAMSADVCRTGGLPGTVQFRENQSDRSVHKQCARQGTRAKMSLIRPRWTEPELSNARTRLRNLYPMPWDLAMNSTGQNELNIPHIWLSGLESQRQLRDRMRAHGRTASFGRHTRPQDERRGAHGLRQQTRSRQNPNGERGGVHDAECLQARSDPAEGNRLAKGSWAESTRTSPAT